MPIRFSCPYCNKVLKIDNSKAGHQGKCPACSSTITAPMVSEDESTIAPPAPISTEKPKFCIGCGTPVLPDGRVCAMCGIVVAGRQPILPDLPGIRHEANADSSVVSGVSAGRYEPAGPCIENAVIPIYTHNDFNIWQAFLMFLTNPVDGIQTAFESLGTKAKTAGLIFGVTFALFLMLGYTLLIRALLADIFIKLLTSDKMVFGIFLSGVIIIIGLLLSIMIIRAIFKGEGSFDGDLFFAGIVLLPTTLLVFLLSIFSAISPIFFILFAIPITPFLCSYFFLGIYGGLTRILKIPNEKIVYAFPVMFIVWAFISGFALLPLSLIIGVSGLSELFGGGHQMPHYPTYNQ